MIYIVRRATQGEAGRSGTDAPRLLHNLPRNQGRNGRDTLPGNLSARSRTASRSHNQQSSAQTHYRRNQEEARSERLEFCIPTPTSASSYYAGTGSMLTKYILPFWSVASPPALDTAVTTANTGSMSRESNHDETLVYSPRPHPPSSGVQIIQLSTTLGWSCFPLFSFFSVILVPFPGWMSR